MCFRFPFRNEEEISEQSDKSESLSVKTPQLERNEITSTINKAEKEFNATFTLNSSKPEELPKSFLGDLPPLGASSGPKNPSSLSLAPLKRIPPVAKVEATKKEGMFLPMFVLMITYLLTVIFFKSNSRCSL